MGTVPLRFQHSTVRPVGGSVGVISCRIGSLSTQTSWKWRTLLLLLLPPQLLFLPQPLLLLQPPLLLILQLLLNPKPLLLQFEHPGLPQHQGRHLAGLRFEHP